MGLINQIGTTRVGQASSIRHGQYVSSTAEAWGSKGSHIVPEFWRSDMGRVCGQSQCSRTACAGVCRSGMIDKTWAIGVVYHSGVGQHIINDGIELWLSDMGGVCGQS